MRRVEEFAQLFGATEVTHNDGFLANNHIMGATIMGDDPMDSVVNGDCRTHDHPNLWIASSSTFPSGSCVNATLTIAALAIRTGESVARSLDAG
jgi:choline dehydrogenase-like flavoprotein